METKTCKDCLLEFPASEFVRAYPSGTKCRLVCRKCCYSKNRNHAIKWSKSEAGKAYVKNYNRRWRLDHPDRVKAYKEKLRSPRKLSESKALDALNRAFRRSFHPCCVTHRDNIDRWNFSRDQWFCRDCIDDKARERRRRHSKKRGSSLGPGQLERVKKFSVLAGKQLSFEECVTLSRLNRLMGFQPDNIGWRCQDCQLFDKDSRFFDVHHVTPRSEGGSNHSSNLRVLCPNCHRRTTLDWIRAKRSECQENVRETSTTTVALL